MADEKLHDPSQDGQADGVTAADSKAAETATATVSTDDGDVTTVSTEETTVDAADAADDSKDDAADEKDDVTLAEAASYEEDDEIPLGKIQAVLNATADSRDMTPQMRRMMQRQADNTKRVEESIKNTKANPSWYVPLFCTLMIIGLIWAVVFYLTNNEYPIPGIGFWNLVIAFAFILAGFLMTVGWR